MKIYLYYLLILILFINCSKVQDKESISSYDVLENVLSFDISFGDENIKDEFLLAKPNGIAVDNDGNIFIADENKIKVFDVNGKEKGIFGGTGFGPGEFSYGRSPTISHSNILTVLDHYGYKVFNLKGELLNEYNFNRISHFKTIEKDNGISSLEPIKIIFVKNNLKIMYLAGMKSLPNRSFLNGVHLLIRDNGDSLIILNQNEETTHFIDFNTPSVVLIPFTGNLFYLLLPDSRLLYTFQSYLKQKVDDYPSYKINVLSLKNGELKYIRHEYNPIIIPDSLKAPWISSDKPKDLRNFIKNIHYYPPVQKIFADEDLLFVFMYEKNSENEFLVNIFDLSNDKFLKNAYFSVIPDIIKNKYAYIVIMGENIFPRLERYRIDNLVYEK